MARHRETAAGARDPGREGRRHGRRRRRTRSADGERACGRHRECTLDCLCAGETVKVACIEDETARVHALRFGMGEGSHVSCVTRIPAGPVILKSGRQEIAVGRRLARHIHVLRDDDPSHDMVS